MIRLTEVNTGMGLLNLRGCWFGWGEKNYFWRVIYNTICMLLSRCVTRWQLLHASSGWGIFILCDRKFWFSKMQNNCIFFFCIFLPTELLCNIESQWWEQEVSLNIGCFFYLKGTLCFILMQWSSYESSYNFYTKIFSYRLHTESLSRSSSSQIVGHIVQHVFNHNKSEALLLELLFCSSALSALFLLSSTPVSSSSA